MGQWTVGDLLSGMQSGDPQPPGAIRAFVGGVVDGSITRPQAAAWLAWAWRRGLTDDETVALTQAMTTSGDLLSWGEGAPLVDKHSTGGVGDKVSLVLAPLWAELGWRVPMISGRGLGHTGGTLDKLESIPGYRTDLSTDELSRVLSTVGCFVSGQTGELAPADRILYSLRNETSTVDSIPLIVGSILSKKLAEGTERLVLDVKVGSGAFMQTEAEAAALAEALVRVARGAGLACTAVATAMDRPLGEKVGNALEVQEAVACLQGGGPDDLRDVVLALTDHPDAEATLASGDAYPRFLAMVEGQGGDAARVAHLDLSGTTEVQVRAARAGTVLRADAGGLGRAAFVLGAGRGAAHEAVDPAVGLEVRCKPGDRVGAGDILCTLHHRDGRGLAAATASCDEAFVVGDDEVTALPLLLRRW